MRIQTVISAVALSAAMMFSGAAFAQTSLGGVEVLPADLPAVQQRCDVLANAKATQSISSDTPSETASDTEKAQEPSTAADTDTSIESAPALDASGTTTFDLETISLDNCVAAGLVK